MNGQKLIILLSIVSLFLCQNEEEVRKMMQGLYGENKEITGNYDESLSITSNNGIFVGVKEKNVLSFKGIPYAKPPIGKLRWKDPVPPENSNKVYEAYYFGKMPIQNEYILQYASYYPKSEDCLYLNIWVNTKDTSKNKPIIVYIHGGQYGWGGTSSPMYDGHNLVEEFPDLIFISIGYRLGILGFIDFSSVKGGENYKTSSYLGLLDIICGLKWIQQNIKNIGGDPEKVTLMGQSSGATLISILSVVNESKGLFKRIIEESGSASITFSKDEAQKIVKDLLKKANANNMEDLIKLSEDKIIELIEDFDNTIFIERDGKMVPLDLYDAYKSGKNKDIDMLLGSNQDESRYWIKSFDYYYKLISGELIYRIGVPILYENNYKELSREDKEYVEEFMKLLNDEKIWKISEFYTEVMFRLPMTKEAEYHSEAGGNTYVYLWKYPGESEKLGACHNIELAYTTGNLDINLFIGNKANPELAKKVHEMWVNFARTGDPSISEISWEKYNTDKRKIMVIDENIEMIEDYKSEQREILDPILKYYFNLNTNELSYFVPTVFKIVAGILAVLLIVFILFKIIKN